ncbi:hypothetical protein CHUAL_000505 [Chamberlinius hualienensis]
MDALRKSLYQLIQRIPGLRSIVITDRDGVPILKVTTEGTPELAIRPAFLSTFGMATDQASKMGLGRNRSIICSYSSYQVVQFNKLPLMVTLIATSAANTGVLLGLEPELDPILEDLNGIVDT